jgi:transcriptional regulator with XRE-family HTH domain
MTRQATSAGTHPEGVAVIAQWASRRDQEGAATVPIGDRIRQLRKERKWSQGDLATAVGGDAGQISRYENGHIAPSADAIVRLAEALDVSCDYLLLDDAPRRPLHAAENTLGDRLSAVAELSEDDLASLRNVIDGLVAKSRLKALAGGIS